jgi:hypothetical protein
MASRRLRASAGHGRGGRAEQVGVGLVVRATDAAAQLVQLGETELVGALDDDRVGIGDVDARLDDRRAQQDVVALVIEVRHHALELRFVHLPVGHGDGQLRQQLAQALGALLDRAHLVVHVEHLAAAQGLAQHRLLDQRRIVLSRTKGLDRQAPRRWRGDDRQVAQAAERHVQRARYRRRGQGQDVDLGAQGLDRVLLAHAEAVLLVDDQQAQVGKAMSLCSSLCVPMRMSTSPASRRPRTSRVSAALLKRDSTSMRTGQSAKRSRKEL